ncbi:MAG: fructosamine kinase family protein, partial [Betaproteobacteria bacterium]
MIASPELITALQTSVSGALGPFRIERATPVAGGCIHRCFILEGGGRRYFAKTNARSALDSFAAEAEGLAALAAAGARVPAPLCRGQADEHAFLVLEHLELRENGDHAALGRSRIERATPVAGGCIHRCFILEGGGRRYFAKTNARSALDSFAAEAEGLAALAAAGARVPAPLCRGQADEHAFLVLEHLELRENGDHAALGRSLAAVHSVHGAAFGWHRDNYIGRTAQLNRWSASWSDFWREERLGPQLELARKNRLGRDLVGKGERLAEA